MPHLTDLFFGDSRFGNGRPKVWVGLFVGATRLGVLRRPRCVVDIANSLAMISRSSAMCFLMPAILSGQEPWVWSG